jgi:hypothetical protein
VKDLTVNLIHSKGHLENKMNEILIEFRDTASGELVDVGTVKFDLDMNMPGMVMHNGSTIEPTGTPGQYRAKVKPDIMKREARGMMTNDQADDRKVYVFKSICSA